MTRLVGVELKKPMRNTWRGYLFLLPALAIYCLFVIYPLVQTVYLGCFTGLGLELTKFVGIGNYVALFTDPIFWQSLLHNLIWSVIVLTIPVGAGMFIAVLLSGHHVLGRTIFRTILFLPQVLNTVVVAVIWSWMYYVDGPVNVVLEVIGLGSITRGWLGDHTFALPALALAYSWAYYGFCMVIFVAALQEIDETLYDSARIDGANSFQEFWYVTLPGVMLSLGNVLILTMIETLRVFDIVYVGTQGGPGYSSFVMSYLLYNYTWVALKPGLGMATGVIQTLFIAALVWAFLWFRRRQQEG